MFIIVCGQGNCDGKYCNYLKAYVQISFQMSLSPCSILKKLKPESVHPVLWV